MNRDGEPPRLDCALLSYPTDAITLGQMRRQEPGLFEHGSFASGSADIQAIATLCLEQKLAAKSFARALGRGDPHPGLPRHHLVRLLDDAYRAYGLSTGPRQSMELIRRIEREAAAQVSRTASPAR